MASYIRRRKFLAALLGGAAAWPLAARAQQAAVPVIGFLYGASPDPVARRLRAFRQGLKDSGYVEGENVAIEYRWAESQFDRLAEMVADLIRRQVTVIAALNTVAAVAAKAASTTIPIVFSSGEDPVRLGLVASLARPGGNATGINNFIGEVTAKRLGLLHELVPTANRVGVLVNPADVLTETALRDVQPAARAIGLQIQVVKPAPAAKLTRLSRPLCASRSTPSSSVPEESFPTGASTLPTRRCAMEFLRPIPSVSFPRSAG